MKEILLNGEIRAVGTKVKKDKTTVWAQKIMVEVHKGYDEPGLIELNDNDLRKVYSVGQVIENLPVFPKSFGGGVTFEIVRLHDQAVSSVPKAKTKF
jgi:hypothetical protein